jgi:hypothetical protein
MKVSTHNGDVTVAHLIPSRGRADIMFKALKTMHATWNRTGTYLAIDSAELHAYRPVLDALPKVRLVDYDNPDACVGKALEVLRRAAVRHGYDYYVMSDDNCRFPRTSFTNLVRATAEWGTPVHMAGAHSTAEFFDRFLIARTMVTNQDLRVYRKIGWILRCVSHQMLKAFRYPLDLPCYADRYFTMWLISKGFVDFRATLDAPFTKHRMDEGGIGLKENRSRSSVGLARLATDFAPTWGHLEARIPWEEIIKLNTPSKGKRFVLKQS